LIFRGLYLINLVLPEITNEFLILPSLILKDIFNPILLVTQFGVGVARVKVNESWPLITQLKAEIDEIIPSFHHGILVNKHQKKEIFFF
jgi:hypothetical protein